jgi:exopolyphosphatase/guanosine-5'-triphosphate,3'-diphosphate pyrophosphatase
MREMVQLAAGLDGRRRIAGDARERALECLGRFGQRLRHMPPEAVRAVGTNTLRSARNAAEFLAAAEDALGHTIETISGREEARLIFLGVAQTVPSPARRRLVLDIGGGSTELIVGEDFEPVRMESFYMGCVSSSRSFFGDGVIDANRWDDAVLAALRELEPVQAEYRELGWEQAVGASGTIRAVTALVREASWTKEGVTPKSLKRLRDAMLKAGHVDRLGFDAISPTRASVFPGGVAILFAAFQALKIERMMQADGALREGLIYDLLGRIREEDVRGRSVTALGDRYHVDWKQAARVEHTALHLLGKAESAWNVGSRTARLMLSWAAQLHEIGLDIAHAHYHKHGEYIVDNADLLGFSREEQTMLGTLVRAHRRKFPGAAIKLLRGQRRTVERLALLLRIAVLLHRSRAPEPLPEFELVAGKKSLALRFPEGWLAERPLSRADLEVEAAYLAEIGYKLTFA